MERWENHNMRFLDGVYVYEVNNQRMDFYVEQTLHARYRARYEKGRYGVELIKL